MSFRAVNLICWTLYSSGFNTPPCWWEYLVYTILGEMRCGKIVINGPVVRIMGQESLKAPAPRIIRGRRPLFHRDSLQQQGPLLCLASCYTFIIIHSMVVAWWTCFHQFVFTLYIGKFGRNECAVPACPIIKFWNTSIFIAEQGWIVHNSSVSDLLIACSWAS